MKFVAKQIKKSREGKRSDVDISDAFGIGFQLAFGVGYRFHPLVEGFIMELGEYQVEIDRIKTSSMNTSDKVEKELHKIANKLKIKLD